MQEQLHYKRSVFCLTIWVILIILMIPVKSYAQEMNSKLFSLDKRISLNQDSVVSTTHYLPFILLFDFQLGLGHHDNLTKAESWTGPEAKTSNTYMKIYGGFGAAFNRTSFGISVSYMFPLPRTQTFSGWEHNGEAAELGLWSRVRLLSMKSKINFIPIVGSKWIREIASIRDSQNQKPDSLDLTYDDGAILFGIESQYTLHKVSERSEYRLILGYSHEYFRWEVDRYRVEFRFLEFEKKFGKVIFDESIDLSLGLEFAKWSEGRYEWFLLAGFRITGK